MIPYACMTDLPTDLPAGSDGMPEEAGGSGGESLDKTREYVTRRMQAMAQKAMDAYEAALHQAQGRNAGVSLGAARDVVQFLTEGKVTPTMVVKPRPLASVTDLAKISEEIRLAKQAERRGGR